MIKKLNNFLLFLSRTEIFFFALLWFMIILVVGTISQKYIGLNLAKEKYLLSYVIWIKNFLPLPGGFSTLLIISINLLAKIIISPWKKGKWGSFLTHLATLLLLIGGAFSYFFTSESHLIIKEGQTLNYSQDLTKIELAITTILKGTSTTIVYSEEELKNKNLLPYKTLPFKINITQFYKESTIQDPLAKISFSISQNNTHHLDNKKLKSEIIKYNNIAYIFELRQKKHILPLAIKLINFEKKKYPNTDIAQEYSSEVELIYQQHKWHKIIKMNSPLRFKGYTLYQSSFIEENTGNKTSILTTVHNIGRIFPYLAMLLMLIGSIVHTFERFARTQ